MSCEYRTEVILSIGSSGKSVSLSPAPATVFPVAALLSFFDALPLQKSNNSGWHPTNVIHKEDNTNPRLSGESQSEEEWINDQGGHSYLEIS
jgi:hypothetical protein